jgi:YfiH family protein
MGDYLVLFGNRNSSMDRLKFFYPNVEFFEIQQVHGVDIVVASNEQTEADGHYSQNSLEGLTIKTADCLPIFIVDSMRKNILGVHAGWRGVALQITSKAVAQLISLGGNSKDLHVLIGPHIGKQSFEVDEPVWVKLMDSIPLEVNRELRNFYELLPNNKYLVDLEEIVRAQLLALNVQLPQIESVNIDTVTNSSWNSHRRDSHQAGRNYSFITRLR